MFHILQLASIHYIPLYWRMLTHVPIYTTTKLRFLTLLLTFFFLSNIYYFYSPFFFQILVFSIVVKLYVGEHLVSTLYLCPIQFVIL